LFHLLPTEDITIFYENLQLNLQERRKKMENYILKEEAKGYIVIDVDTSQVVEATKKAKKLLKLLKKANSLADELASKEILLNIDVQSK
jgi:hypothetical protein